MNEITSAEKIFLGKLEVLLQLFDEADNVVNDIKELIEKEPEKQRQLDLLLSDYYHRLENENLTDVEILNIGKKIHDTRVMRRDENRVSTLIACFERNKNKIQYSVRSNREMFRQAIKLQRKSLHEDYKYRVLTDDDIKALGKDTEKTVQKERKKRHKAPTKEELEECFNKGMKVTEVAKQYGMNQPYISLLKKKYGLNKKD